MNLTECIDNALELLVLEEADLSLDILMSIFMFELSWTIRLIVVFLDIAGFNVFTKSVIGTIIQYGDKREGSVMSRKDFFLN